MASSSDNPYPYCLPPEDTEGEINDIKIRWQDGAFERLADHADAIKISLSLAKALTEHFLYLSAQRIGNSSVKITYVSSAPTRFLNFRTLTNSSLRALVLDPIISPVTKAKE